MSLRVCFCLSASGSDFGYILCRFRLQGAPSGHVQGTWILNIITLVAGRRVCVSAFVCLPLGRIFGAFFIDLGSWGAPWGHINGTWTPKMTNLVPHLAGVGPRDIFSEFGVHFGSHFGHHFGHWRSLLAIVASFWHPFFQ